MPVLIDIGIALGVIGCLGYFFYKLIVNEKDKDLQRREEELRRKDSEIERLKKEIDFYKSS